MTKGYITQSGYMGYISAEKRYQLFPTEQEYLDFLEDIAQQIDRVRIVRDKSILTRLYKKIHKKVLNNLIFLALLIIQVNSENGNREKDSEKKLLAVIVLDYFRRKDGNMIY